MRQTQYEHKKASELFRKEESGFITLGCTDLVIYKRSRFWGLIPSSPLISEVAK